MTSIPIIDMILRSGWVARIIILLLTFFSFITWAVIINRLVYFANVKRDNRKYKSLFDSATSFKKIVVNKDSNQLSPLESIGNSGAKEYKRIIDDAQFHTAVSDWSFYLQNQFFMAKEKLDAVSANISSKLDSGVFVLAVISSVAPFLGLLGTVWGIMNSFFEIGNQGSASLTVVAPGIAEALVTTVAGLVVAIPSVFFYNIFVHRAERVEDEMDEFEERVLLRLKKELFDLLYGNSKTGKIS